MRNVSLGGLEVSCIGLGCMGMSQAYGKADLAESERTLNRSLDIGVTFLDTANVYGLGHNETLIGRVLKARRREFVLATKFGIAFGADGRRGIDGDPAQVATRCDESLQRLQTDVIDLYYLHRRDPKVPIEDTVGAMADLVKVGKVRHIGLSEVSAATLRRAHAVHPIAAVQSEYSLWTRDPETHVLPACRELGIGFVPFSPLGRAMLTGRLEADTLGDGDMRRDMPRFQGDNFATNARVVQALAEFAQARAVTPGQIAIAWLLAQAGGLAPIPGTKRVRYLEENVAAASVQLSAAELAQIDELFAAGNVVGERYAPAAMVTVDRD